jgi:hypothetical protein
MVPTVEGIKSAIGDEAGEQAGLLEHFGRFPASTQDEGRNSDLGSQVDHVDVGELVEEPPGVLC